MNRCGILLSLLGVCCLVSPATDAATGDNPYRTIVDRNPFGLNPPPPPAIVPPPTNTMPRINITGITGKGENRRAWFSIVPKDPKETQYVNLPEGQRKDSLEVLEIREDAGEVTVRYGQTELVLNMKEHAPKAAAAAAARPMAPPVSPIQPRPVSVAAGGPPQPPSAGRNPNQSSVQVLGATSATAPPAAPGRPAPTADQPVPGVQILGATSSEDSPAQRSLRGIPPRSLRLTPSGAHPPPQEHSNTSAEKPRPEE